VIGQAIAIPGTTAPYSPPSLASKRMALAYAERRLSADLTGRCDRDRSGRGGPADGCGPLQRDRKEKKTAGGCRRSLQRRPCTKGSCFVFCWPRPPSNGNLKRSRCNPLFQMLIDISRKRRPVNRLCPEPPAAASMSAGLFSIWPVATTRILRRRPRPAVAGLGGPGPRRPVECEAATRFTGGSWVVGFRRRPFTPTWLGPPIARSSRRPSLPEA